MACEVVYITQENKFIILCVFVRTFDESSFIFQSNLNLMLDITSIYRNKHEMK